LQSFIGFIDELLPAILNFSSKSNDRTVKSETVSGIRCAVYGIPCFRGEQIYTVFIFSYKSKF